MRYSCFLAFYLLSTSVHSLPLELNNLPVLANQYEIKKAVLIDFVDSYNYKCPSELSQEQLVALLSNEENETDLSTMLESDQLESRDIYVEARSMIRCFTQGAVSQGY